MTSSVFVTRSTQVSRLWRKLRAAGVMTKPTGVNSQRSK
jgi:hypothetical protein